MKFVPAQFDFIYLLSAKKKNIVSKNSSNFAKVKVKDRRVLFLGTTKFTSVADLTKLRAQVHIE